MAGRSPATDALWAAYRRHAGLDHDNYEVVAFGDDAALATELAELVVVGPKRATAALQCEFDAGEAIPILGGYVVVVDGTDSPRCVWQTTDIRCGPLNSVDDSFAWDEGEGDRTRNFWLSAHRRYFAKVAARLSATMHDGIETVFERFRVVWPLEIADRELIPSRRERAFVLSRLLARERFLGEVTPVLVIRGPDRSLSCSPLYRRGR